MLLCILTFEKIRDFSSMEPIKKILVCSAPFKEHLSSREVNLAISKGLAVGECDIQSLQIADGGDGTLDVFSSIYNNNVKKVTVKNPQGIKIITSYLQIKQKAVIELAKASGLATIQGKNDALTASTYGTGQLIRHAIDQGIRKIVICLGGSATTDCGIGILVALGVRFYDDKGSTFQPQGGKDLLKIVSIDSEIQTNKKIEFECLCDGFSVLGGKKGAWSWAKTKGATEKDSLILKAGIEHFINLIKHQQNKSIAILPCGGCAGGVAAGLYAFFNTKLLYGPKIIFSLIKFDTYCRNSDLVITGEGTFDERTFEGKDVSHVLSRCRRYEKPCIVVTGRNLVSPTKWKKYGITAVFETNEDNFPLEKIRTLRLGPHFLANVGKSIVDFLKEKNLSKKNQLFFTGADAQIS